MTDPQRPTGGPGPTPEPDRQTPNESVADAVGRAVAAFDALADLGESVDGEWQYVTDLRSIYGTELRGLAGVPPERMLPRHAVDAVDTAIEEIALITDPHRAIDWLSTFPQVVRLALAPETGPG